MEEAFEPNPYYYEGTDTPSSPARISSYHHYPDHYAHHPTTMDWPHPHAYQQRNYHTHTRQTHFYPPHHEHHPQEQPHHISWAQAAEARDEEKQHRLHKLISLYQSRAQIDYDMAKLENILEGAKHSDNVHLLESAVKAEELLPDLKHLCTLERFCSLEQLYECRSDLRTRLEHCRKNMKERLSLAKRLDRVKQLIKVETAERQRLAEKQKQKRQRPPLEGSVPGEVRSAPDPREESPSPPPPPLRLRGESESVRKRRKKNPTKEVIELDFELPEPKVAMKMEEGTDDHAQSQSHALVPVKTEQDDDDNVKQESPPEEPVPEDAQSRPILW